MCAAERSIRQSVALGCANDAGVGLRRSVPTAADAAPGGSRKVCSASLAAHGIAGVTARSVAGDDPTSIETATGGYSGHLREPALDCLRNKVAEIALRRRPLRWGHRPAWRRATPP